MSNLRTSDAGRTASDAPDQSTPYVWAIASGKGGVGKSVVSTNFAVSLAGRGHSCALLDLDLGCANLHTMLGVTNGRGGLSRLIEKETDTLAEAMVPTGVSGLSLLSGDHAGPGMANLSYAHKHKILRQARRLDVDHVVLDLGAGTSFNVLDFFLEADTGIVVVVPEPTSIENTYDFLLAAFLRSLRAVARRGAVRQALDRAIAKNRGKLPEPRDLLAAVVEEDAQAGVLLWERFESFTASLIVNRVRNARHHELGPQIVRDARKHFGAQLRYAGAIVADDCVVSAVVARRPAIHQFPGSNFTRDLETVTSALLTPETLAPPTPIRPQGPAALAAAPGVSAMREIGEPCIDLSIPGASLRLRREELGLTLTECEHRTRIRCLEEIESEQFDELPPEQYLRAFIAQYAMLLGIDEAAALAAAFVDRYRQAKQGHVFVRPQTQAEAPSAPDTSDEVEAAPEPAPEPEADPKPEADGRVRSRAPLASSGRRRRRARIERSLRRRGI
jgi:flagellar biosynthesis protein FlhG